MYYRRKLLLSILQKANSNLGKINLQKLLFLITREQIKPCFDFVPYKYGCFSFQANKDLDVLSRHYFLLSNEKENWILKGETVDYFSQLKKEDQNSIDEIFKNYDVEDTSGLTKFVYDIDPYFTIHSELNLSNEQKERKAKEKQKIQNDKKQIFSIGYEGISIDAYLNTLVKNNIKLLCDVRKNPLSMKYGFSKNQLKKYCENLHIDYVHIPDLGIESQARKNLNTHEDYYNLFEVYKTGLKVKTFFLQKIKELLNQYNRIALTCFEKDHKFCHRDTLIKYYIQKIENIKPIHL